ncbi:uncharacterized protein LOC119113559 [Pollicipes pollicipes]|uniref:uncharacterized protein LOC119113559 n=1 Tax=Pollicipes pollicipes TaxID=41117 RepID=UPI0018855E62|nr:uncharacterized protein LOC119113559 [Pollicipes pollicipes]
MDRPSLMYDSGETDGDAERQVVLATGAEDPNASHQVVLATAAEGAGRQVVLEAAAEAAGRQVVLATAAEGAAGRQVVLELPQGVDTSEGVIMQIEGDKIHIITPGSQLAGHPLGLAVQSMMGDGAASGPTVP